ncbi:MAG: hypothetical protein AB7G93_20280 [Bdellovibrionales bacterium]
MNPTGSDSNPSSSTLERAEEKVTHSVASFEHAMEELAQKVEETSHRMQHVMDLANRQKAELARLTEKAKDAVQPIMPYVERVRRNPRPFVMTAGAIALGVALIGLLQTRRSRRRDRRDFARGYERPIPDAFGTSPASTPEGNVF